MNVQVVLLEWLEKKNIERRKKENMSLLQENTFLTEQKDWNGKWIIF